MSNRAADLEDREPQLDTRYVLRIDRTTIILVVVGLALVLLVAVLVTMLVTRPASSRAGSGDTGAAPSSTSASGVGVTLNGPDVATYIAKSYSDSGVTCPTLRTPVGGTLVCSDRSGGSFTVKVIDSGGAYTVHPN